MRKWKPKFYIVYPMAMIDHIHWPEGAPYRCAANLTGMLKFVLNTGAIGAEIKLIWNWKHREIIMEKNNVSSEDIDNYVKANSCMLSFLSERTRDRAAKILKDFGGVGFIYVNSYRDVILQQAFYFKNKEFNNKQK